MEGQSLRQAVAAELRQECRFGAHRIGTDVVFLGHQLSVNGRDEVKRLVGLFVPLLSWQEPETDRRENRKWCVANCWDQVADLMVECSLAKRCAVLHFLENAVRNVPLFRQRWGHPTESFELAMKAQAVAVA